MTQCKPLAEFLLKHLLKKIDRSCLISEITDRNTCKTFNEVNHEPLAAIVALSLCFGTKEMESVVESEFASVFVPLLMAMASYCGGISRIGKPSKQTNIKDAISSPTLSPFQAALNCMQVKETNFL